MQQNTYDVNPTGQEQTDQYSDIAMTSLFNAHVSLIHSERVTIWQRYSAMLIANSVIVSFMKDTTTHYSLDALLHSLSGLILCVIWFFLTRLGWSLFYTQLSTARRFNWSKLSPQHNPIEVALTWAGGRDWIRCLAYAVIGLFFLIYLIRFISLFLG